MQAKTRQAITPSSESPDTPINFQGYPAHRAGQRGSHKPATSKVGVMQGARSSAPLITIRYHESRPLPRASS